MRYYIVILYPSIISGADSMYEDNIMTLTSSEKIKIIPMRTAYKKIKYR